MKKTKKNIFYFPKFYRKDLFFSFQLVKKRKKIIL